MLFGRRKFCFNWLLFYINHKIFPLTSITQDDIIFVIKLGGMVRRLLYCIISGFPPDKKFFIRPKAAGEQRKNSLNQKPDSVVKKCQV